MKPFATLTAKACALGLENVDTDQIIPARFLRRKRSDGYGEQLFHDVRRTPDGTLKPDFPVNRETARGAQILVARRNFGCGSSREAAVYALADAGFAVVLAPSYGDIFSANAVKNGVVAGIVADADCEELLTAIDAEPARAVTVDLAAQTVSWGNRTISFAIDPVWKEQLLNGWDDIDMTRSYARDIQSFKEQRGATEPWSALS